MTEDKVDPPDWYTSDVDALTGWNMDSTLTDSISGMFEEMRPGLRISIPMPCGYSHGALSQRISGMEG